MAVRALLKRRDVLAVLPTGYGPRKKRFCHCQKRFQNLCLFYVTCVRSVIDYAAPVFHYSLPAYLTHELERVQRRAMRIICPGIEYQHALALVNLPTVAKHHNDICKHTFENICNDSDHKLKKLLPPLYDCKYNLRHARTFNLPRCKTNRFKNSFIMASCSLVNAKSE